MAKWAFAAIAIAVAFLVGGYVHPLLGVCAGLVLLPPSLDPAIRLKEWLMETKP